MIHFLLPLFCAVAAVAGDSAMIESEWPDPARSVERFSAGPVGRTWRDPAVVRAVARAGATAAGFATLARATLCRWTGLPRR